MKADEYADKHERLSWISRQGNTVKYSIEKMKENGKDKGVVYEFLERSRRALKAFYKREFEIPDAITLAIEKIDDGEPNAAKEILTAMLEGNTNRSDPDPEMTQPEPPREKPKMPWDQKEEK